MPSRQQFLRDKGGKMGVHLEALGPLPPEAFLRLITLGCCLSTLGRLRSENSGYQWMGSIVDIVY